MAKLPFYTSNTLIEAVKRNISFPISQVTFDEDDILRFADEEMFLEQIPSILQYHEEYLVYNHTVPMQSNVSRYDIPSRAIGMKLRDLFYLTTGDQLIEMSRINPDDKSFMQTTSNTFSTPIYYYVENNQVVITPQVGDNISGSLMFSFYLRPNALVPDERAMVCQSFSKTITINNAQLVAGDELVIGDNTFIADTDFAIGVNNSTTATNLIIAINNLNDSDITASSSSNIVSVTYADRRLEFSTTNSLGLQLQTTITINTTDVPSDITSGSYVDILQFDAGHSTLKFDIKLAQNSVSLNSLTFSENDIPDNFIVGDYVCARYECIVPQIPTDLHMLLGERTSARILSAIGDRESVKDAQTKIDRLETKQTVIIDNRVEGSPLKVVNRSGLLNSAKVKFGRRVR